MFQYLLLLRMVADRIRVFTRNCNLTLDSTFTSTICVSIPVATEDGCRPDEMCILKDKETGLYTLDRFASF